MYYYHDLQEPKTNKEPYDELSAEFEDLKAYYEMLQRDIKNGEEDTISDIILFNHITFILSHVAKLTDLGKIDYAESKDIYRLISHTIGLREDYTKEKVDDKLRKILSKPIKINW
jgi:hypothetical protein